MAKTTDLCVALESEHTKINIWQQFSNPDTSFMDFTIF